jgi:exosortase E/protease (VPEID-CTERM system)
LNTSFDRISLPARLGLLVTLLVAEKILLGNLVDSRRAQAAQGIAAVVREVQHWGFRFLVTFLAAAAILILVRMRLESTPQVMPSLPKMRWRWLLVHGLLVASLAPVSYLLYREDVTQIQFAFTVGIWILLSVGAVIAAVGGLSPRSVWQQFIGSFGITGLYAVVVALLGTSAWLASEQLWDSTTAITFELVKRILIPVLPVLTVDPATRIIATAHFAVEITQACSGLEGLGLTLAFSSIWLVCFRREYIFPRALILIPISLLAIFGLNAVRIAALLLIGDAGFPDVALYGFHSQAGWIAFNGVAGALVFFSRRIDWLNKSKVRSDSVDAYNPTATYVLPLLAMLAAGTLSHALSGHFETYYSVRALAVLATLFFLRHSLATLGWSCSWRGPAVGACVFLLWIGAAHYLLPALHMPQPLIAMSRQRRTLWIVSHCLVSIALVPIVEELAYRGYLMRRLVNAEFELIPYRVVGWPALTITAIAFGAAHGALWLPGIAAGLLYGSLVIRRGSLGEAIAAHATSNALLAATVLAGDQWELW